MHYQNTFQNQFLIAMPQQHEQHFNESLIYLCEHNTDGAMGLIVNKPLPLGLNALAKQMGLKTTEEPCFLPAFKRSVFYGGPCQSDHGFILHTGGSAWSSTMEINDSMFLTSSKEIFSDIAQLKGPEQFILTLGYAGWESGQLEEEMCNNVWLNVDADIDTIFSLPPEQRWVHAAASLGIDINLLSADIGRA